MNVIARQMANLLDGAKGKKRGDACSLGLTPALDFRLKSQKTISGFAERGHMGIASGIAENAPQQKDRTHGSRVCELNRKRPE